MPMIEKVIIIGQIFELGFIFHRPLRSILSERPYAAAFVVETASIDVFRELADGNGY